MPTIEVRGEGRNKTYRVKIRRRGLPPETKTFDHLADAKKWARDVEHQIDRGTHVSQTEAERTTLAEALTRYASEVTPTKKSAPKEINRINQLKQEPIAQRLLASIRGVDLAKFRDMRLKKVSASTVRLDLALISHVYTIARTEWGMESLANPVANLRKPKSPKGRDRRLEDGEEERLLESAKADAAPWIWALIVLALETAMRLGELLKLNWKDVHVAKSRATVRDTKNGEDRTVPLSPRALGVLKDLPHSIDGRVFPVTQSIAEKAFGRVCRAAAIKGLRFHDLRHEATSRLFERGFDIMEVREFTGHKTLQMLLRYTHLRTARLAAKLQSTAHPSA